MRKMGIPEGIPVLSFSNFVSTRYVHSLHHSARIPTHPQANLSGWFLRPSQMWTLRRWLELRGPILTYRHTPNSVAQWCVDVRECQICAGRAAKELVIRRPHCDALTIIAPSVQSMKLWFATLKRVSDNIQSFYHTSAQISNVAAGSVLLGRDKLTDERVSVFALDKRLLSDGSKYLLSRRDAGIIRSTQTHKSTLRVIDVFETTHVVHVITELITGGSLYPLIQTNLPLSSAVVRGIAQDLLQALAHIHASGIIHGSVDAHNVAVVRRKDGESVLTVKLIVFGVASYKDEGDVEGYAWTSRHIYGRAPEVVCFQQRSEASDVFECAVLLFMLLTGSMPFAARTDTEYLSKVSLGLQRQTWSMIPQNVEALLRMMLQDDPGQRPKAADCLKHEWFLQNASISDIDSDFEHGRRDSGASSSASGDAGVMSKSTWAQDVSELARVASDPKSVIVDFEGNHGGSKKKKL